MNVFEVRIFRDEKEREVREYRELCPKDTAMSKWIGSVKYIGAGMVMFRTGDPRMPQAPRVVEFPFPESVLCPQQAFDEFDQHMLAELERMKEQEMKRREDERTKIVTPGSPGFGFKMVNK